MTMPVTLSAAVEPDEQVSLWRDAWHRLRANRLAVFGLCIVVILVFVAVAGPWISPYDFLSQDLEATNQGPSMAHWFGTDDLGRDVLSRVIYGARTALLVAVVVTGIALAIGVTLGAIAGYVGGRVDAVIMWVTDMVMSVPSLLLVVVINTSLKPPLSAFMDARYLATHNPIWRQTIWIDFVLVFGSMALILWPPYARLVRAQVLSIRNRNYVTAARALGLTPGLILRRYVVPNALGPVIVAVSAGLGTAMVLESAFSFLGVGVRPPTPSWGNMISDGLRVWRTYPHLLAAPAAVLGLATVAFSFLGDGLNDALNPRQWRK
ncbi:Dipeptide transport system permease protein DppC [Rubellimicrobium mesophilum DSM 19309]|uniref:Dipeptide transport system permease protein DppC n=1 Tax=Rubellimicrobium mesophilum DSM 19309 TaxID=442562 RepID=A0A017HJ17_9RHOB|nr:ABC transporter permease [Rubellimicrobium mesophilum]EYD74128.1 Dipeptide transport system permease protein DppC [Rubellimicrobium mesophilum DSM 19309]